MQINSRTVITGLIGYPVEHSFSPDMHNAAFIEMKLNYCYIAMAVSPEELPAAIEGVRALNFGGINVTVPHKEHVIPLLDEVDEEARFIGAVNTIRNENGVLKGYNTDGRGFMESLKESGIDTSGSAVFILGSGGAARAVGYYLSRTAARISILDINQDKCLALVRDLKGLNDRVICADRMDELNDADIVINATPLGLGKKDPLPFDTDLIRAEQVICDLIYWDTPLIRKASGLGCRTINGLGMLLWQGVLASSIWTGVTPPVELMRDILQSKVGSSGKD